MEENLVQYSRPTENRGNKDPHNISERIKIYGNYFSVYDIDNLNLWNISLNNVPKKIFELKTCVVENNILKGPATKLGQLAMLYFNLYPSYLSYCIVEEDQEERYIWLSVPCNYAAVMECGRDNLVQYSEKTFAKQEFGFGGEVDLENIKEFDNINIKGYNLKVPDSDRYLNYFPYKNLSAIENILKLDRKDNKTGANFNFYDKCLAELMENNDQYRFWNYHKNKYLKGL